MSLDEALEVFPCDTLYGEAGYTPVMMISATWIVGSSMSMGVCADVGLEGPCGAGTVGVVWLETAGGGRRGSTCIEAGMPGFGRNIETCEIVPSVGVAAFTTSFNGEGLIIIDCPELRGTPDAPLGRRGGIMSIQRWGSGK